MKKFCNVQNITVAELVIRYLELEGVEYVFGIPGGYINPFLQLLRGHPTIKLIISRHEEGAAFMADGYARATGKLGVVFATAGPGATNALTGVASAQMDGVPMLIIDGQVSTDNFGFGALQDSSNEGINLTEIFRHACGMSELAVSAASFPALINKALRVAHGAIKQTVHLTIPLNIASSTIENVAFPTSRNYISSVNSVMGINNDALKEIYELLEQSEKPVILLGSGCRSAFEQQETVAEFSSFVNRLGIAVITSPKAKGIFPESDNASLGVFGLGGGAHSETFLGKGQPDVVLVLGSSLNEWATARWSKLLISTDAFIHVDLNPAMIGRTYSTTHSLVADAKSVLEGLFQTGKELGVRNQEMAVERGIKLQSFKDTYPVCYESEKLTSDAVPIKAQRVFHEINQYIKDKEISFFIDMGNCTFFFSHFVQLSAPNKVFTPCGFSSMGWASGAVIGAKIGRPDMPSVCITGDGAFLMNGVELQTAARYGVAPVYIVLYDNYYGMVHHGEMSVGGSKYKDMDDEYYSLGEPDLVKFSESLGAVAYNVTQPGDFEGAFSKAIENSVAQNKPQVIVVSVDHREKPPVGERFKSLEKQLTIQKNRETIKKEDTHSIKNGHSQKQGITNSNS